MKPDREFRPAILLVEDEAIVAQDIQATLTDMGYDAYAVAASAAEALECARERRPDIVLMDIRIKGPDDGIQAAAMFSERFGTAVIFLTAHADDAIIERAKRTEPYGYLVKPVKAAELRSMIEITTYRRERDEARAEAARLDSRLQSLNEINLQLASEREPRVLLEKVCLHAREMFNATSAVLLVNEKVSNSLFCATSGLSDMRLAPRAIPPLDTGPLGRVYAEGTAWRARSPSSDALSLKVLPPGYPAATAYLAVPISSLSRTYGWLCLMDKRNAAEFTAEDEHVLGVLAVQAGRMYENGSLYYDLQLHAAQLQVEMDERERAAADLRRSEERFRQLAENINDVFFILSADLTEMTYHSPAFENIWGRPYNGTNPMDWTTAIHATDRQRILDRLTNHAGKPVNDEFEFRIIRPNGAIRWIFTRHFPLLDAAGQPQRIVGIATDITERKLAEAKIHHLNRVYAVLSGINALIIRSLTQSELFDGACRLAVDKGGFQLAWIGWLKEGQEQVTPLAWAGKEGADRFLHERLWVVLDSDVLQPICRGEAWVCNDLLAAGALGTYRSDLLAQGLLSVVSLPLMIREVPVGCLVLAADERDSFDSAEMHLLTELAGDISFALDHLEKTEKLNYLAYYDSLTGLANRTLFLERLAQQVDAAKRSGTQFAVVVRDPERFTTINETFGRNHGDLLLKDVAERLCQCVGERQWVARIGSDQFASVLPFSGEADVAARALEEQYEAWMGLPFRIGDQEVRLTARAGISIFPDDGGDAESLLKHAEAALKRASSLGDRMVFFTPEIGNRISERLSMETRLRRGLENEEFVLHYQPKVNLETRKLEGLEALIRWQSPELGLIPPGRFIPLMEETGMIIDVGTWVLMQACVDRCAWLEQGIAAPRVAVNVSSVQLRRPDFLNVVRAALKRATRNAVVMGAAEAGIDMEVTETLFVDNVDSNMEKLRALRLLGVGIAIDDFGTGYSSLGYLAQMPADSLKIDRSFTEAMLADPTAMTLVSTIITLAQSLRLQVIAEGVESEEQAKILRLLRCDQMQGYLISKPIPFAEMTSYLLGRGA
jgi:diguanylate cyclase (GGDEF)-like protein/PAS domain S-box-containing protein